MQQNEKKWNFLPAFDQREDLKKIQDGFLQDTVIHRLYVSARQCLVGWRDVFFILLISGRKHT